MLTQPRLVLNKWKEHNKQSVKSFALAASEKRQHFREGKGKATLVKVIAGNQQVDVQWLSVQLQQLFVFSISETNSYCEKFPLHDLQILRDRQERTLPSAACTSDTFG